MRSAHKPRNVVKGGESYANYFDFSRIRLYRDYQGKKSKAATPASDGL